MDLFIQFFKFALAGINGLMIFHTYSAIPIDKKGNVKMEFGHIVLFTVFLLSAIGLVL